MSSVALISDGFHNLADAGSFGIALYAEHKQKSGPAGGRAGLWGGFINCCLCMLLTVRYTSITILSNFTPKLLDVTGNF